MFIALVYLSHIYVDLIVSATNVLVVFLSTINKHFLLLLLQGQYISFQLIHQKHNTADSWLLMVLVSNTYTSISIFLVYMQIT